MSAGQHTRGRLVFDGEGRIDAVDFRHPSESGYMGGLLALPYPCGAPEDPSYATASHNARRIVACWNACIAVPTEVLEAQQSGGLPWNVGDQIDRRVLQRELLTELEHAHDLLIVALGCMTDAQQAKFAKLSERRGLGTDGATRHHERAAVLAKCRPVSPLRVTYADKLTPEQVAELQSRKGGAA
jgi:hypothetical protein